MTPVHPGERLRNPHFNLQLAVGVSLLFSLGLLAGRILFTHKLTFIFLAWNLFLALVPLIISMSLARNPNLKTGFFLLGVGAWLLFFPNAPYIFTDFIHLRPRSGVPYWFDIGLLSLFAWNGLMLGYISLMQIHRQVTRRFNPLAGWGFVVLSLMGSGLGIYLGRFLRWNSWDLVRHPGWLISDVLDSLLHPFSEPRAWGVTLMFGVFLLGGYLMLCAMVNSEKAQDNRE